MAIRTACGSGRRCDSWLKAIAPSWNRAGFGNVPTTHTMFKCCAGVMRGRCHGCRGRRDPRIMQKNLLLSFEWTSC